MCLIFISLNHHPSYKLLIAGNRDEFYNRPTQPAGYWDDNKNVLAGRDLEAGGTWLGVTTSGRISMLTNYRDPKNINPNAPSRGALVSDYLQDTIGAEGYLQNLNASGIRYNGFNLLAGTADELFYYSNYQGIVERLQPGFYGISNKFLETPWPKVVRGKQKIGPAFAKPVIDVHEIFDLLYDDATAPTEQLPETGLTQDRERALSAMFIKTGNYGSRCSTVIAVDHDDNWLFSERTYDPSTFAHQDNTYRFSARS
ncbi:NRDE family protein [Chryseolinea sp. T2]|uniref:NRDE family protein n=1 Tax=Chryseolinea sp. T2 TaxID=3129255 RepID=UPI00307754D5